MMTVLPPPFDLAETDRLLSTTRAVRRRLDLERPVDLAIVAECLQLATQAPTGGNAQGWRWLVVEDPATKAAVADVYRRAWDPYFAERLAEAAAAGFGSDHPMARSSQHLADVLDRVPVLVVPCLTWRSSEAAPTFEVASMYASILPAVWSFALALRSRGLGTTLTTMHLYHEEEVAEILGIPDHVTQVALLPVAHTIGLDFKPAERRDLARIAYLDRWKQPLPQAAR